MQLWLNSQFFSSLDFFTVSIFPFSILAGLFFLFIACHSFIHDSKLIEGYHFRFPAVHKATVSILILFNCVVIPLAVGGLTKLGVQISSIQAKQCHQPRPQGLFSGPCNHSNPLFLSMFSLFSGAMLLNTLIMAVSSSGATVHAIPKIKKKLEVAPPEEQLELLQDIIAIEFFYKQYDAVELHSKRFLELCQEPN